MYTRFNRDISIQTSSLPIKFFIVTSWDWLKCGFIESAQYVLTLTLSILVCTLCCTLKFVFTIYQQHCNILTLHMTYETGTVWRWPQKMTETCRNYLHIWISAASWKQTYLCMHIHLLCKLNWWYSWRCLLYHQFHPVIPQSENVTCMFSYCLEWKLLFKTFICICQLVPWLEQVHQEMFIW
jgi:hypothetical protein